MPTLRDTARRRSLCTDPWATWMSLGLSFTRPHNVSEASGIKKEAINDYLYSVSKSSHTDGPACTVGAYPDDRAALPGSRHLALLASVGLFDHQYDLFDPNGHAAESQH